MPDPDLSPLLAFFKAMANESRLRIVGLLAQRERTVQELAETLQLKEPTVSHHLAVLKALGLIDVRPEGVMRWHALKPGALAEMNRKLLDQDAAAMAPEIDWEGRVMAAFVDAEGKLKSIPAARRKRWVVLKWLAARFENGRRYAEAEVNEILQQRHWDSATLRRELIGARMLAREAGVYWRLPEAEWKHFADQKPDLAA
ncbi:metalloregulator ArsR/SmtB family transcription factor [Phenylobacterium sp.]|jgi:hypothetical protein|uniref:DUF2087 domain-containing protein n=1 Tax=Phenylobacterium sp. TaxID=1871053 RepID=UPI002F93FF9E